MKLKKEEIEALTPNERAADGVWQNIRSILGEQHREELQTDPTLPERDSRRLDFTADIIFTAYGYGLFEDVSELEMEPTRIQAHDILEKVFQNKIRYEFSEEESAMTRIEFARMFVQQHALIGNRVASIKSSLVRLNK